MFCPKKGLPLFQAAANRFDSNKNYRIKAVNGNSKLNNHASRAAVSSWIYGKNPNLPEKKALRER